MKRWKTTVSIALLIGTIVLQGFYLTTIRTNIQIDTQNIAQETIKKEQMLQELENNRKNYEGFKELLEQTIAQRQAIVHTIPESYSVAKDFMDLVMMMQNNGFKDIHITEQEETSYKDKELTVIEKKYDISYNTSLRQSQAFLQTLTSAYQMVKVHKLVIDNTPQTQENDDANKEDYVKTSIEISLLATPTTLTEEEIYHSQFNPVTRNQTPFLNKEAKEKRKQAQDANRFSLPMEEQSRVKKGHFALDLYDIYVSGDTYAFEGPGINEPFYMGIGSSKDAKLTLVVNENGYEAVLEDEEGKVERQQVSVPITSPTLTIRSQMRQIEKQMPNISIAIHNTCKEKLAVQITGTFKENIHVYNEYGQEVSEGQVKGNVKRL